MPYNLRKRSRPAEPEQKAVVKPVKKKARASEPEKKPVVKPVKEKTSKSSEIEEKPVAKSTKHRTKPSEEEEKVAVKPVKEKTKQSEPEEKVTKKPPRKKAKQSEPEVKVVAEPVVEESESSEREEEEEAKPAVQETELSEPEEKEVVKTAKKQDDLSNYQLVFGADSCGELGLGKIGITKKSPTSVPIGKPVKLVACGPMHTLSLTEDGEVYSYGCNDEGALGRITDLDETLEAKPTLVALNNKVVKITAGDSHSAVLTDKEEVFIWGNFRDEHGSVGLTPSCEGKASYKPIQLLPQTKFTDIASGSNHMLLLDREGVVYSFGVGAQGQLGRLTPEEIGDSKEPMTDELRDLLLTPQKVSLKEVDPQRPFVCDAIYAGNFSSFATNTDKKKNRLAGWGLNNYFQLGYKGQKGQLVQHFPRRSTFTCSTSMIGVACGQHHTLFLTRTGRVYAAGRPEYGMLGLGKVGSEICPAKHVDTLKTPVKCISASINTSFAVNDEGQLYSWGMGGTNLGLESDDDLTVPTKVTNLEGKKVIFVSAGGAFTAVVVE